MPWDILGSISDYALTVVLAVTGWVGSVERRFRKIDNRVGTVERRQQGDDANPNNPGMLEQVHQLESTVERVDEKLDEFRDETHQEHRQVMKKLEEVGND